MGWPNSVVFPRQNIARKIKVTTDLTPELERRIQDNADLDLELYEFVSRRLDEEIRAEGEEFAAEVARLRRKNHWVYRAQKTYRTLVPKKLRQVLRKLG